MFNRTLGFEGPSQLQEQTFVRHIVSEGPVVTTRMMNHAYRQLPGTSVRYMQTGANHKSQQLMQQQQQQQQHMMGQTAMGAGGVSMGTTQGHSSSSTQQFTQGPGTSVRYVLPGSGESQTTTQHYTVKQSSVGRSSVGRSSAGRETSTVVKKQLVSGTEPGSGSRTIRRSYHQVATMEGLTTEDLEKAMQQALPGMM